mmetsp:Transcript_3467/g.6415  ORF Transcript_3467/g.6415 Transcript_3467/m.6415 type:complete len:187 (-) Transcript_3467:126-686(-)
MPQIVKIRFPSLFLSRLFFPLVDRFSFASLLAAKAAGVSMGNEKTTEVAETVPLKIISVRTDLLSNILEHGCGSHGRSPPPCVSTVVIVAAFAATATEEMGFSKRRADETKNILLDDGRRSSAIVGTIMGRKNTATIDTDRGKYDIFGILFRVNLFERIKLQCKVTPVSSFRQRGVFLRRDRQHAL